jgi:hypothetical protein
MTTPTTRETASYTLATMTSRSDAIRVVPLKLPPATVRRAAGIAAPAAPLLIYRGGPLLTACDVVVLFWGAQWNATTRKALRTKIGSFFQFVLTSPLLDQLAEYNVPQYRIGHGTFSGSLVITTPAPQATVTDAAVRAFLKQQIATNPQLPKPTPNRLYFIFLPPGVVSVQGGTKSCTSFCGYHDAIPDPTYREIYYSPMPYPGCAGCRGGLTVIDALTSTSSHELCEAITDAVPGFGWYDDAHGEIGDICPWRTKKLGNYRVQLEWSNRAGQCM